MSIEPESIRTIAAWALAACAHEGLDLHRSRALIERLYAPELGPLPSLGDVAAAQDTVALDALGARYERLLAHGQNAAKKRRGSFYTPAPLARRLCEKALASRRCSRVLDPSCGAGAVLLEALDFADPAALHGVDIDPVAVWLARVSLSLRAKTLSDRDFDPWCSRIRVADALAEETFDAVAPFDAIVGNPPWVSYAGRSAEPLPEAQRASFRRRFHSFAGFPTAQGMFVERAASLLAEGGRLALLVPTSMADLAGYTAARSALARRAVVDDPLDELGFDQFDSVVQPTVILAATARSDGPRVDGPWILSGRDANARPMLPTSLTDRLASLARFDPHTFGEGGFQTAKTIARTHLGALGLDPRFSVPLREGSDVLAFAARPPSIGLDPEPAALAAAGCSLRSAEFYQRVTVVVRQTARYPVAARNEPAFAFRNSLLAGFSEDPDALCALLNSSLLRAVHLASQRDGRQAVFPQLKVAHLRALPAPPADRSLDALRECARRATAAQRERLAVVSAYGPCPKTAFEVKGERLAPSDAFVRSLKDRTLRQRFDAALASAQSAWTAALSAMRECDERVFELYDVREAERDAVRAVLA